MKIYIAGFDVFSNEAVKIGKLMKEICKKCGFEGLFPLDNQCSNSNEIFKSNLAMIDQADILIANINPFRGKCMDDGTAFEIGYAYSKCKTIYAYVSDLTPLVDRIGNVDECNYKVEDFGHPVNLMIAESAKIIKGTFADCIIQILKDNGNKENISQ